MPEIRGHEPREHEWEVVRMFGLTRWNQPRDISGLRHNMEEMFDRLVDEERWMPGRTMRSLRSIQRDLDELFGDFFGSDWVLPASS